MLEKPKDVTPAKKEWKPELAASFEVEFLNSKSTEVKNAMSRIGNFEFRNSGPENKDSVYFEGGKNDGTRIRIVIKKGKDYKSPKEVADEMAEGRK